MKKKELLTGLRAKNNKRPYGAFVMTLFFALFLSAQSMYSQTAISGTITDDTGEPLPGASVVVKGTNNGTNTDFDGNYSLSVKDNATTLEISFVGFSSQDVAIAGKSTIDVQLEADAAQLDEVVLIGYGSVRKKDLTGAISTISSADLENVSPITPDKALQGKVSGVQVRTDSHAPGGGISVQIRGTSSIGASSQPLYVIDGFPVSNDFDKSTPTGWGAPQNQLNSLDPSDIASIQILKDASSTAIYGSRANNGVVIITTKRGSYGKSKVEYDGSYEVRSVSNEMEFMNATEQALIENEAHALNNGQVPIWTDAEIAGLGEGTDWQDVLFRSALTKRHKLSISGGNDKVRYRTSANYLDEEGLVVDTGFKRFGTNLNVDANVSEKLTLAANMSFTGSENDQTLNDSKSYSSQPSLLSTYLAMKPYVPAYDDEGNISQPSDYKRGGGENPLFMAKEYQISGKTNRLLAGLNLNYQIIDGLNFRTQVGIDQLNMKDDRYYPIASRVGRSSHGRAEQASQTVTNFLNENTLEYKKEFGNDRLSVLGGFTYQTEKNRFLGASASGFPSDFYGYHNLGLATNPSPPVSSTKEWTLMSYLGRANYVINDKYMFTATARYDGSSRFGDNNKYGFFPSGAVAWVLSEEDFIKDLNVFSQFKMRVGYGQTGNERIGYYRSKFIIGSSNSFNEAYVLNNSQVPVAYPNGVGNPDLTWEKGSDINVGFDLGFLDGRLSATIDIYKKETTDMLLEMPVPIQNGFSSVLVNSGSIENKGIEFSVSSLNVMNDNFSWSTDVNLSHNENKITSLGGGNSFYFAGWVGGGNQGWNSNRIAKNEVGGSLGRFWGLVYEGVFQTQSDIDNSAQPNARLGSEKWADLNNDGKISIDDQKYVGNPNPDIIFGVNNDFTYKRWKMNVFVYGEQGQDVLNLTWRRLTGGQNALKSDRDLRFHPVNNPQGTTLASNVGWNARVGSHNVEDGSFVRVRNISLSYDFDVDKIGLPFFDKLSVSAAADNPVIWTKYRGYDPEVNSYGSSNDVKGVDRFAYPSTKGYRFGLKASF